VFEIPKFMQMFDKNGDGMINRDEF
jgi:Ca2+-binding EF-hand superfamily protein